MDLSQDDVIQILKLIDEAPFGRVRLQLGEFKLEVVKGEGPRPSSGAGEREATGGSDGGAAAAVAAQSAPARATAAEEPMPAEASTEVPAEAAEAADQGLAKITAPILGTFYRRPQPGAPLYVDEGSLVEADTTVALIEVMKLFNPVKAGIRGRIRKVCAENGKLVEYGQTLFLVEPE
jgi:acetyl-CoA carboxylase biotin carboxyl carrier protein